MTILGLQLETFFFERFPFELEREFDRDMLVRALHQE